ncbi:hypothetical protein AB0C07_07925 [Actinoplanes missouriensis]|uniref:hypothetical protein n=1 Tax=Actinoplanes missouriensis TaxID=1866 RepID=UPI0033C6AB69
MLERAPFAEITGPAGAEAAGVYVGPGYTGAGYLDGDPIAAPVDGPGFVVRPKGGNWQIHVWKS